MRSFRSRRYVLLLVKSEVNYQLPCTLPLAGLDRNQETAEGKTTLGFHLADTHSAGDQMTTISATPSAWGKYQALAAVLILLMDGECGWARQVRNGQKVTNISK